MKKTIIAATLLIATPALADMNAAEFFQRDRSGRWTGPLVNEVRSPYGTLPKQMSAKRQEVARIVAREAQARLGSQWVDSALKLAKIESSYNCAAVGPKTRHGRARGVLQVLPSSARALGFDPSRLNECDYGVRVGTAHMEACIRSGVKTHAQMAACHVAGWGGWNKRLARKPEIYKQQYIRLAMR
jgi:hypothetical protein